jgi:hypothetical protein
MKLANYAPDVMKHLDYKTIAIVVLVLLRTSSVIRKEFSTDNQFSIDGASVAIDPAAFNNLNTVVKDLFNTGGITIPGDVTIQGKLRVNGMADGDAEDTTRAGTDNGNYKTYFKGPMYNEGDVQTGSTGDIISGRNISGTNITGTKVEAGHVKATTELYGSNLITYYITSTGGEDSWIDVKSNLHLYNPKKFQIYNNDSDRIDESNKLVF